MATPQQLMVAALEAGGSLRDVETIIRNTNSDADAILAELNIREPVRGRDVPVGEDLTADLSAISPVATEPQGVAAPGSMEEILVTASRVPQRDLAADMAITGDALSVAISGKQQPVVPGVPVVGPIREAGTDMLQANILAGVLTPEMQVAINDQDAKLESIYDRLEANMDKGAEQHKVLAEATAQQVKSKQTVDLQADQANLQAQKNVISVHKALGGHEAIIDRAEDQYEFEQQREVLGKDITEQMTQEYTHIGIIDDVINTLLVTPKASELRAVNREADLNISDTREATLTVQNATNTALNTREMITDATIVANQKILAAEGQIALVKAEREQNQSNAVTLRTLAGLADSKINALLKVEQLKATKAGTAAQRDRHRLALKADARAEKAADLDNKLDLIQLQRSEIQLSIEGDTIDAVTRSRLLALDQQEQDLRRGEIALTIDEATLQDNIDKSRLGVHTAATALQQARHTLDKDENMTPGQKKAQDLQLQSLEQALTIEEAKFEEWNDMQLIRQGTAAAQFKISNATATESELRAEAAVLMKAGKEQEALAKLEEAARVRGVVKEARVTSIADVVSFQDFILGPNNGFTPEEIEHGLAEGNKVIQTLRQLGAVSNATGAYALGAPGNYAAANANLVMLESAFPAGIDNTLPSVKALRDIRVLTAKEWSENPASPEATGDEVARELQFNRLAEEYVKDNSQMIVHGDTNNPFHPNTIPSYIQQASGEDREPGGFTDQPLTKILAESGQVDSNIPQIFEVGMANVQAGRITLDQHVAGILSLGQQIAVGNMSDHHGLSPMGAPNVTYVNMRLPKPRGFLSSMLDSSLSIFEDDPMVSTTAGVAGGLGATAAIASTSAATIGASVPLIGGAVAEGAVLAGSGAGFGTLTTLAGGGATVAGTGGTIVPILLAVGLSMAAAEGLGALATNDYVVVDITNEAAIRAYSVDMANSYSLGGGGNLTPESVQEGDE